jgi:hypothetical protein
VAIDTLDIESNTNSPPAEYKDGGIKENSTNSLAPAFG